MHNTLHNLAAPQLLVGPESRLIPVGSEAWFTCKFSSGVSQPYWKVNETEASNSLSKNNLRTQGFFIADDVESWSDGSVTLSMRVDGSNEGINNTIIQCKSLSEVHSQRATLLTIAGNKL